MRTYTHTHIHTHTLTLRLVIVLAAPQLRQGPVVAFFGIGAPPPTFIVEHPFIRTISPPRTMVINFVCVVCVCVCVCICVYFLGKGCIKNGRAASSCFRPSTYPLTHPLIHPSTHTHLHTHTHRQTLLIITWRTAIKALGLVILHPYPRRKDRLETLCVCVCT
jgi:hypothetical protein